MFVLAKNDDYDDDYWQNDYNDQWYQDELEKLNGEINYLDAKQNKVDDKDVSVKDGAHNDDYQIEDNRYVSDEKEAEKQNDLVEEDMAASFSDESNSQDIPVINNGDVIKDNVLNQDNHEIDNPENESQDFDQDSDSISFENDNNQDLPLAPNIDKIIKETQDLLKDEKSKIEDSEIQSQELILNFDELDTNQDENKNNLKAIIGNVVASDKDVKRDDNISQADEALDETNSELDRELDEIVDDIKPISQEIVNDVDNVSDNLDKQEDNNEQKLDVVESFQLDNDDDDTFVDPEDKNSDDVDINKNGADENNLLDSIETNENSRKDSNPIENIFQNIQQNENVESIEKSDEDDDKSVEDIYNNLNEDLDKLLDTLQKLSNDVSDNQNVTEKPKDKNEVLDYEEKYDRPFREGVVLQMRQNDDYDFDEDSSESNESLNGDNDESIGDIEQSPQNVSFGEDAINDGEQEKSMHSDKAQNLDKQSENDDISHSVELTKPETETKLSDDEVQKLMNQFVLDHDAELDTDNDNFDRDIAVVNMQINYEEPLTLCSPNYPGAYPANNIIDWMFDGDGMGIELNVTDLVLNGVLGDFLLVKPGKSHNHIINHIIPIIDRGRSHILKHEGQTETI